MIDSCYGITPGIAWRNKLYNTLNWNANPAKVQVRCSSNQQVLSCLAQGSIRKKQGKSGKGRGIYYLGSALSTQKEHGSVKCVLSEHSLHYGWSVPGEVISGGRYPLAPSGEEEGGELQEAGRLSHWFYSPSSSQATYEIRYVIYPVAKVVNE